MITDATQHLQVQLYMNLAIGGAYQETSSSHKIIQVSFKMLQQILKWVGSIGQHNVFNYIQQ